MAITDNRTLLSGFETVDTVTTPDDLSGSAGGTADTEIFIQGSRSFGYYSGSSRDGLLYDAGTAQNWSGNTFYLWVNCGIAGLLNTKAAGGMTVRFCGATVSDWFEVYVAGSDDYPKAVNGGWVMLVVDIDKASASPDNTNGTAPAASAVRYVGVTTQTPTMPRMADNTWVDAMWRLPSATPGIQVEGQNTGSVDWTWDDIVATAEAGAWGTAKSGTGGSVDINTPIRFGANDAVTHGFSDTNKTILWEDWDVATSFYGLEVVGGSGVQSFELGIKTGTGDDASGAQGCVVQAASAGQRWYFDCDDANVDAANLYGCSFIHGGDFQLDGATVSAISTLFIDCTSAQLSNIGDFLACTVINANTADGVPFCFTDDLTDIVGSTFQFSDGHAVGLLSGGPTTQTSKGNKFSGYAGTAGSNLTAGPSGSTDAAIENDNGSATIINVTGGGDTPSVYNNTGTPSTTVNNNVSVTLTGLQNPTEVRVYAFGTTTELTGQEDVTTGSYAITLGAGVAVDIRVFSKSYLPADILNFTMPTTDTSLPVSQVFDRTYTNP
jgi:hypothetical protein